MPTATCHCGSISIEIADAPDSVTECNCSICRRYGVRWAYFTRQTARIASPPGATATYMWGDRMIKFHHCKTCGCVTHYEGIVESVADRIAVNANNLPPEITAAIPVRHFDGANTWKYTDA